MNNTETKLGKLKNVHLELCDRTGHPVIAGHVEYAEGGVQGFPGYMGTDMNFVKGILGLKNSASEFKHLEGHCVLVTGTRSQIQTLAPAFPSEGKPFSLVEWSEKKQKEKE